MGAIIQLENSSFTMTLPEDKVAPAPHHKRVKAGILNLGIRLLWETQTLQPKYSVGTAVLGITLPSTYLLFMYRSFTRWMTVHFLKCATKISYFILSHLHYAHAITTSVLVTVSFRNTTPRPPNASALKSANPSVCQLHWLRNVELMDDATQREAVVTYCKVQCLYLSRKTRNLRAVTSRRSVFTHFER